MPRMVTYLAGVQFKPGSRERLAALVPGEALTLKPEPENKFDKNAVAVYDGDMHLGYVPKVDAPAVSSVLQGGHKIATRYTARNSTTEITIDWETVS